MTMKENIKKYWEALKTAGKAAGAVAGCTFLGGCLVAQGMRYDARTNSRLNPGAALGLELLANEIDTQEEYDVRREIARDERGRKPKESYEEWSGIKFINLDTGRTELSYTPKEIIIMGQSPAKKEMFSGYFSNKVKKGEFPGRGYLMVMIEKGKIVKKNLVTKDHKIIELE